MRNFIAHPDVEVVSCYDLKRERQQYIQRHYPTIEIARSAHEIASNSQIDLVAICTPVSSHFELAKECLNNDKHVFIEKPMTATSEQSKDLLDLADKKNLLIFTDHTFLFTGSVTTMKNLIREGDLGDLYYFDSTRVNLGLFRHDVNVIWDLAAHDLSIMQYLIDQNPESIVATGARHIENNHEDLSYITVFYQDNLLAHINVSWLSPVKVRQTLLAGSKKMVVWDDNQPSEKLKIYDKGVESINSDQDIYQTLVQYRTGDMYSPKIDTREALAVEVEHIVRCINRVEQPLSDGHLGLRVVKMLELAQKSIESRGKEFKFDT